MTRRMVAVTSALALQLIALVLAHDLTFLARFGSRYGEELAHAGHGQTWTAAVASSLVLAILLAGLAGVRLLQLGARVRRERAGGVVVPVDLGRFLRAWLGTSARIGLLNVALLTIQENLERASIGQAAPGPGILLSPEYPFGLWIALGIGAVVALVAALFVHRARVLLARLRAARAAQPRPARTSPRHSRIEPTRPAGSILGRRSGLRAPPLGTPA
jgi:hypothetical protein